MFAPTIDHPDYGILFVAHHRCPHTDAAGERQLVMAALKLIRRLGKIPGLITAAVATALLLAADAQLAAHFIEKRHV